MSSDELSPSILSDNPITSDWFRSWNVKSDYSPWLSFAAISYLISFIFSPFENSSSFGKVKLVRIPKIENTKIATIGKGAGHSLTIGAIIVIERAIIPHVPTEVFRLSFGNILSSVKET
jgi:hypothetical protein